MTPEQRIADMHRRARKAGLQAAFLQPKALANWTRAAWELPTFRPLGAWVPINADTA